MIEDVHGLIYRCPGCFTTDFLFLIVFHIVTLD